MSHNLPPDVLLQRLSELLVVGKLYTITFAQHTGTGTLIESRRAKGKDQGTAVKKVDGKLVPCWLYRFDAFDCFILINDIQDIGLIKNGCKITFKTYTLEFTCTS
jgi:hypothetical protein